VRGHERLPRLAGCGTSSQVLRELCVCVLVVCARAPMRGFCRLCLAPFLWRPVRLLLLPRVTGPFP
jgi:hypothetical protein